MKNINLIFEALAESPTLHVRSSVFYSLLKELSREYVESNFAFEKSIPQPFGMFGEISFPYTKMGAIDSLDLFGLDELIIFTFYYVNRRRYTRVLDIGANLGLHSTIMSKCGFEVKAFEPDPWHFSLATNNLKANSATNVTLYQEAVSTEDGEAQFVRVLGNTTGSHLAGFKESYGEKEHFDVKIRAVQPLFQWADLAKIDVEGHEKEILSMATSDIMQKLDIMVEIGNPDNAKAVFDHFKTMDVRMFSQKLGWEVAISLSDLPTSHREGSLFISSKQVMPWRI